LKKDKKTVSSDKIVSLRRHISPLSSNLKTKNAMTEHDQRSDYIPPSVLQQQVQSLEQLMHRQPWLDLNDEDLFNLTNNHEEDLESEGSETSLKEELDDANHLLPGKLQTELELLEQQFMLAYSPASKRKKEREHSFLPSEEVELVYLTSDQNQSLEDKGNHLSSQHDSAFADSTSISDEVSHLSNQDGSLNVSLSSIKATSLRVPELIQKEDTQSSSTSLKTSPLKVDSESQAPSQKMGFLSFLFGNRRREKQNKAHPPTPPLSPARKSKRYHFKQNQQNQKLQKSSTSYTIGFDGKVVPVQTPSSSNDENDSNVTPTTLPEQCHDDDHDDNEDPNVLEELQKPRSVLFASSAIMVASLVFGEPKSNALNLVSFRYC
jgi:hypothetical protein